MAEIYLPVRPRGRHGRAPTRRAGRHARRDLGWVRQRRLAALLAVLAVTLGAVAWQRSTDSGGSELATAASNLPTGTSPSPADPGAVTAAADGGSASVADAPAAGAAGSPAAGATTSTAPAPPITLAFAGDILTHMPLTRGAAAFGQAAGLPYDYRPMLAPMQPVLSAADLALCHLEVPIAPSPDRVRGYPSFGAPPELVAGIAAAGYDGCSIASNHTLDQGFDGVRTTLDTFDVNRLGHTGSARTAEEAATPRLYDVKGVAVAHLSYSYGFNGYPLPDGAPWAANLIDPATILADARAARASGAQLVVVSLHWGTENVHEPSAEQRALAPVLTASPDVDAVIGHHAHVVQPIEWINGKPVVFGLGNQLSNQRRTEQRDGLTVVVTATPVAGRTYGVTGVRAVPTYMDTPTWRVLPITSAVADPATPPALRDAMRASYARTFTHVTASGPVPGLTVDPLPA